MFSVSGVWYFNYITSVLLTKNKPSGNDTFPPFKSNGQPYPTMWL